MSTAEKLPELGPFAYENWKAAMTGTPLASTLEYPLFTDANIIDEPPEGYGPYQLLNAVPVHNAEALHPSIFLRVEYYLRYDPKVKLKTDIARYHGGHLSDEVAALVSLCLGVRLKSGGYTRFFKPDEDPKGHPASWEAHRNPALLKPAREEPVLPRVLGDHNILEAALIAHLPALSAREAVALIRSARLYQDAVWIAESEPSLSWLMLVSAAETAAVHWRAATESHLERLQSSKPELVELLIQAGGEALATEVANGIADSLGSTKKFTDFVLKFMPEPPVERPTGIGLHPWESAEMRRSMQTIYKWRSHALHGGIPFPKPMCRPPRGYDGGLQERPIGLAAESLGGVWAAKDTPMLLHTFEYIVRHALLNWWKSMVQQ